MILQKGGANILQNPGNSGKEGERDTLLKATNSDGIRTCFCQRGYFSQSYSFKAENFDDIWVCYF